MKKETSLQWGILSDYRAQIMGFAILWIMVFHGYDVGLRTNIRIVDYVASRGSIGVELFLIVSGIGMYYSLSKGYNLKTFYKKRIQRVVLPYLSISLLFWVAKDLVRKFDVVHFLLDYSLITFWTERCRNIWFVALIIPLYFVTPWIYERLKPENKNRIRNLVVFTVCFFAVEKALHIYFPGLLSNIEIAFRRILIYVLAIYFAPWVKQDKKVTVGELLVLTAALGAAAVLRVCNLAKSRWTGMLASAPLTLLFAYGSKLVSGCKPLNRFAVWCGNNSLELYMLHVMIRRVQISIGDSTSFVHYGLVVLASFVLAYIISLYRKKKESK